MENSTQDLCLLGKLSVMGVGIRDHQKVMCLIAPKFLLWYHTTLLPIIYIHDLWKTD